MNVNTKKTFVLGFLIYSSISSSSVASNFTRLLTLNLGGKIKKKIKIKIKIKIINKKKLRINIYILYLKNIYLININI